MCKTVLFCVCGLMFVTFSVAEDLVRSRNVYQKISQDPDLSSFKTLLKTNRIARIDLSYEAVTVFVPEDAAFERFTGLYDQQLTYYHISYQVKTLQQIALSPSMTSVKESFPPLWLSRHGEDLYVNNAKIIEDRSDFLGKARERDGDKIQMLHVIDEVLDPIIRNTTVDPTAHLLLSTPQHWRIKDTLKMFSEKVTASGLEGLFQNYSKSSGHTFFIPIDKNIDDHRYNLLDNYTIQAHIVPNMVLFTRPANKHFFYESMCNGDYIYILCSFVERGDKIYAKSTTVLGDSDHPKGEILSEIIHPNIPVKNGVVHLISKPLVIFDRELKPFPFLSVFYKISSDPYLDYSFKIGENTGLNSFITNQREKKITYFVPRDNAWKTLFEERTFSMTEQQNILSRHIVIDDTAFTMERLMYLSQSSYNGSFILSSLAGGIMLNVLYSEGSYFINFHGTFIRVYRPNYLCEDGVIHVLEVPFLYENEKHLDLAGSSDQCSGETATTESTDSMDFWSYLIKVVI